MANQAIYNALGLVRSNNQLTTQPGALDEAKNVIIRRDGVIESRRGFKIYGSELSDPAFRVKQIKQYRQRIIRHYTNLLAWDDGNGSFTDFAGTYNETETGLRIKSIEANGNFYFTTSDGIKKLSLKDPSQYATAKITNAGGVKALDLETSILYKAGSQTAFLPQDSTVAYRIVWATRDANNNLILGAPSQRSVVYNPMMDMMIQDFSRIIYNLDLITDNTTTARISDGDYFSTLHLPINATAASLRTNLVSLASKLDNDILYATDTGTSSGTPCPLRIASATITTTSTGNTCNIVFNTSGYSTPDMYFQPGSKIFLTNFTISGSGSAGDINGIQNVITSDATSITFTTTAHGTVNTVSTSIKSGEYRSITEPTIPGVPTTNAMLVEIQNYMNNILARLQQEPPNTSLTGIVITTANQDEFISILDITQTSTVLLKFAIPEAITSDYFYQIYRSSISQATDATSLQDLSPNDELQLIYEAYPTPAELTAQKIVLEDITPDEFRGANLYTNASTGEGITQSNDIPPFCKDLNRFKNVIFYANTKTRHKSILSLIGVQNMIDEVSTGGTSTLTITSSSGSQTYTFVIGEIEQTTITCVADVNASLNGKYFDIYSANDLRSYRFWYYVTGEVTPVIPDDGKILQKIIIAKNSTANQVSDYTKNAISLYVVDFNVETTTLPSIKVSCTAEGYTTDFNPHSTGFTYTIVQGIGESAANKQVLLSNLISVGTAVELTAKSLVRVINQNSAEQVYGYYISSSIDVPGKMYFEAKSLSDISFSMIANNSTTGSSFNPDLTTAQVSENEIKKNRIYYSKYLQPEAVPIPNYFDVGSEDKAIVRIYPLRDSLFVFKEDGLYRVSGEYAPFNVALFDSSCIVIAPDSIDVTNNFVYGWSTQGIVMTSESNVQLISRPIDVDILLLASSNYPNFKTATWGLGYESDNSYTVYSVSNTSDTYATKGWRFSNLTNSWTTIEKTATCGIINPVDDKIYLGAGDVAYLEQERKSFTRTDYADREYSYSIATNAYVNGKIRVTDIDKYELGDVFIQNQPLTVYGFNMTLKKLDDDLGLPSNDYYSSLIMIKGQNIRTQITRLANKLDSDLGYSGPTSFTQLISPYGETFGDIQTAYNIIINKLNNDPYVVFSNYQSSTQYTTLETVITNVNRLTKEITLADPLDFYLGVYTIFKGIACEIIYTPMVMEDPSSFKHLRELQLFFEDKKFTQGRVSFATDLLPMFNSVDFYGHGNGIFGSNLFGSNYFGGASHSAPIRTYIPRDCQRCTYVSIKFEHIIAREKFSLFGINLIGDPFSTRAYR